jgi:molybdopterin converting factor small subunit
MKIIINTFSSAKTLFGFTEKQLDLREKSSVGDALALIFKEWAYNENIKNKLLFAVNEEYCDQNKILHNGDQLAIFPPVSGG